MTIHERALEVAGRYKRAELDLIEIILEIDSTQSFREKDFTSTYDYCLKFLKLSEPLVYSLISIARKSKEVPQLKEAIKNELITVSKASRIVSVLTPENSKHWLSLAESLPKAQLGKEVARVNPQVLTPTKVKYVTDTRLKLELGISEGIMKDLKRAQEILAQKNKSSTTLEETLGHVLKEFLKR